MSDPLDAFSQPVRQWFTETFGEPTPPQTQGWLPIQRGEHTLILAPTGSGKTLAAFLWGIDELYRILASSEASLPKGVHLLYVSPLKALNNDIERNLRVPLEGIRGVAARLGDELPELRVAVRTGDTPSHLRAAMLKKPPHILITTPESLYLMLTSPRARDIFRTVRTVIVDEIHTLAGNKRGVHLSLSLERLEHLIGNHPVGTGTPVQRIGLSATIKPLEEVARFLGGQQDSSKLGLDNSNLKPGTWNLKPRSVTIVNAVYNKPLDLHVITVVDDFRDLPGDTIWVPLIPRVLYDIRTHKSTLIFANNRRLAERSADRLNAQLAAEETEEIPPGSLEALAPGGVARDRGMFALGAEGPIRAHHGSMSKAARHKMEQDLKGGRLPALVGTSSLELGIDIGAVDLVVQLQSPKSVAQGLQRVGRSGHLVGETSVGHIYPTFREDLVEAAAIARGMLEGDVEPTYTPENPLDVLAQQIVATVAVENWSVPEMYHVLRRAYAYRNLSFESFRAVLAMLSGKYADIGQRDLRARIVWDTVNDRVAALPGSRLLAMTNAGTISDRGAYGVYLEDRKTKVGELDEEFVFETRVGDSFLLGSKVWRVLDIADDRIVVGDASGSVPRMPFWHGDYPWRPFELGVRIGKFRREIAERIQAHEDAPEQVEEWLASYALDKNSTRNLIEHVERQLDAIGVLSSDKSIVLESFEDAVGEPRLVIHSPFGGRVNGAWALALTSAIQERQGVKPETQTNDDGILFRFPGWQGAPPIELVRQMTAAEARERILAELPNSALFGAHFRMNAARALLLPKSRGQKRTPFWLQRLKAKDLLATVIRLPDFPIVAETYRECLRDVLDLDHLEQVLNGIAHGEIRVVPIETVVPSPVASGLLAQFAMVYMYEWDAPKAERQLQALSLRRELLDDLLATRVELSELLKPEAVEQVTAELQHRAPGYQARTAEELALLMQELGDQTIAEIRAISTGDGEAWLAQLEEQGRVTQVEIPTPHGIEKRWVLAELAPDVSRAALPDYAEQIVARRLRSTGPVTRQEILERYALEPSLVDEVLTRLSTARAVVRGHFTARVDRDEFLDRHTLEQMRARSISILRKEVQPVPLAAYADFLTRWQHTAPETRLNGEGGLAQILEQLQGIALAETTWERQVLPARLEDWTSTLLSELISGGQFVWVAEGSRVRLFPRGTGALHLRTRDEADLSSNAQKVYEYLQSEGASFAADLKGNLRLDAAALRHALAELASRSLITNDAWGTLEEVTARRSQSAPLSPLESELARRLTQPRSLTRTRYNQARRRISRQLHWSPATTGAPSRRDTVLIPPREGRWAPVYRAGILGPALSEEERAEKLARVILARYGVVARECLEREDRGGDWEPSRRDWAVLYPMWQRMEMRGEVRRGYFVTGLGGIQFALPEAVEQLRAPSDETILVLNATDPANPYGAELSQSPVRLSRVPSTFIVFQHGRPLLIAEDNGERITIPDSSIDPRPALQAYLMRPSAPRHTVIKKWNGAPVLKSPVEEFLESLGFHRTPHGMEQ